MKKKVIMIGVVLIVCLGTVLAVADANGDKKLTIAFNSQGIKNLMQSIAKLELL